MQLFHGWIRDRIADNTPMDEFARSIISAAAAYTNPAANYFRAIRKPQELAEATAQVFSETAAMRAVPQSPVRSLDAGRLLRLGQCVRENRLQTAEKYPPGRPLDKHEFNGEQVVYMKSNGSVKTPRPARPPRRVFSRRGNRAQGRRSAARDGQVDDGPGQSVLRPCAGESNLVSSHGPWTGEPDRRLSSD